MQRGGCREQFSSGLRESLFWWPVPVLRRLLNRANRFTGRMDAAVATAHRGAATGLWRRVSLSGLPTFTTPLISNAGASEVEIARTLAEGVHDMQGSTPQLHENHHDLAMPKFDHLSEVERRSIALYVISMQKNDN